MFKNKTLLITGGTGSFGETVLRRFLKLEIKEIRIFSRDEKKQEDMRISFNDDRLKFYIGDVRELSSISQALDGVDYVFHAAALKQVPSCEFYPMQAIYTNVLGTENVLEACSHHKIKNAVLLSTDKAVYPINAMGMTKALMEKIMLARARKGSVFSATRYGNVMASRGSVIPLFISQIKSGKPITITDPSMTRFMMSLEDSVDLVLHAFVHANPGDIFVQKSPSATIEVVAQALLEIFQADNEIKIIGTRHSEKLFETLLTREEMLVAEDMGEYYRIPADNRDLNYASYFTEGEEIVESVEDYNSHNSKRLSVSEMKEVLRGLEHVEKELSTNG